MNSGMCWISSYKFIDGRQSSSSLGMMCNNKSLPSASVGLQNCLLRIERRGYLGLSHDKRWLEREFVSEEDVKVKLVNAFVHILTIDRCLVNFQLRQCERWYVLRRGEYQEVSLFCLTCTPWVRSSKAAVPFLCAWACACCLHYLQFSSYLSNYIFNLSYND